MTAEVIQKKIELMIAFMVVKNMSFSGCDNFFQS